MNRLLDYLPVMELPPDAGEAAPETAVFDEGDEMALGAGLLEVENRPELESFLASLVAQAGQASEKLLGTPLGLALVGALARAVQPILPLRASPLAGRARDAAGGNGLPARAARIFGLELEGLSPEDKEFEVARHFVRFAGDIVNQVAAKADAGGGDPQRQVQAALAQAARRYAPGLLRHAAQAAPRAAGRWRRQGTHIVVLDC